MVNNKNMEIIEQNNFIKIIKGTAISVILSLVLLMVLSVLLSYTNLSENIIVPTVIAITSLSILVGSLFSALKIKKQGIVNGAIVGGIYIVILYILSSVISQNFNLSSNSAILIILGVMAGSIGGIIGVNIRHKKIM